VFQFCDRGGKLTTRLYSLWPHSFLFVSSDRNWQRLPSLVWNRFRQQDHGPVFAGQRTSDQRAGKYSDHQGGKLSYANMPRRLPVKWSIAARSKGPPSCKPLPHGSASARSFPPASANSANDAIASCCSKKDRRGPWHFVPASLKVRESIAIENPNNLVCAGRRE